MPLVRAIYAVNRVAQFISSAWVVCLALIILIDVVGRGIFSAPFKGAPEIIGNSIAVMAFLQAPHAISLRAMLRGELVDQYLSPGARRMLDAFCYMLGTALFAAICYASIDPAVHAWDIGEYEGEGALRVPTYPVRMVIIALSALASLNYFVLFLCELGLISREQATISAQGAGI
jgi:TRAP-type C4-dicarboxylate transport system permease small subunit